MSSWRRAAITVWKSSYWTNFVKTGDPNGNETFGNDMPGYGSDLPRWEPFTKEEDRAEDLVFLLIDQQDAAPLILLSIS